MGRKIGELLFLVFFVCICEFLFCQSPNLFLKVTDANNMPLKQAGIGVPFNLQLSVENVGRDLSVDVKKIDGILDHFSVSKGIQGSRFYSTVNGKETVSRATYQYIIRIDKPGKYIIGPAHANIDGASYNSDMVTVAVDSEQQVDQKNNQDQSHAWIELNINAKQPFFVGQNIPISLTAYADSESELVQFQKPSFPNYILVNDFGEPVEQIKEINNKKYRVVSLKTTIIANRAGRHVLPSVSATVNLPSPSEDNPFRDMQIFLGSFLNAREQKRISSKGVVVNVLELPEYQGSIDAIGSLNSIELILDQEIAHEGEGIVATLKIKGKPEDIEHMHPPAIILPEQLKSYESHISFDKQNQQRKFEYIVQGIEPGTFEIQAQKISFFNPELQQYKTVTTQPIVVTILPGKKPGLQTALTDELPSEKVSDVSKELALIDGPMYSVADYALSPLWFFALAFIIILIVIIRLIILGIIWYRKYYAKEIGKKRAFIYARKSLTLYEQQHDATALYQMFISLFAARFKVDEGAITKQFIEDHLKSARFDREKMEQWKQFFLILTETRFFSQEELEQSLFARSRYWIIKLEQWI